SGLGVTGGRYFGESIPARLDRLIAKEKIGPGVMVFPDCFTSLGGNQYLHSPAVGQCASYIPDELTAFVAAHLAVKSGDQHPAVGQYAIHIHDELIPFVEAHIAVKSVAQHRAVLGKSSGGFAAIRFAMDFPDQWAAIANHSGDAGFDVLYRRDFPLVAGVLADFNGDIDKFVKRFWRAKKIMGSHIMALMHICLSATYDPQKEGIRLPFDLETCALDELAWSNWLAHDPVQRVAASLPGLRALKGLYMDYGFRDQYFIQFGMR